MTVTVVFEDGAEVVLSESGAWELSLNARRLLVNLAWRRAAHIVEVRVG